MFLENIWHPAFLKSFVLKLLYFMNFNWHNMFFSLNLFNADTMTLIPEINFLLRLVDNRRDEFRYPSVAPFHILAIEKY